MANETKVLVKERWNEYDGNGNVVHCKDSDGFECWNEYDENNNLIHCRYLDGFEYWKEYDTNGNCIHYWNSKGAERWYEYDYTTDGNILRYKEYKKLNIQGGN